MMQKDDDFEIKYEKQKSLNSKYIEKEYSENIQIFIYVKYIKELKRI